tara:strand:+ start:907 stop:1089 length:183 start_codon:yes stop_codon:yes gene_type:complete
MENITLEIDVEKAKSESETNNNEILINKEEFDKKCAKYSTAGFLCGVFIVFLYGVVSLNN